MIDREIVDAIEGGSFEGVLPDIQNRLYHSCDKYTSSTQLKESFEFSPLFFKAKYIDKLIERRSPSKAMLLGSTVHHLVLEPNKQLSDVFFILPELDLRTKAGREEKANLLAEHAEKILITSDIAEEAVKMAESVFKNSEARDLLAAAKTEVSYFWKCPYSALNLRARVDGVTDDTLIELKTADSAKKDVFEKQADRENYDLSMWHYMLGLSNLEPEKQRGKGVFIVVESSAPYVCEVYPSHDTFLEVGKAKWLDAINGVKKGIIDGLWEGYSVKSEIDSSKQDQFLMPVPWTARKYQIGKDQVQVVESFD